MSDHVAAVVTRREAMQNATAVIEYQNPAHHRFLFWLGMLLVKAGLRIAGVGQVDFKALGDEGDE